MDGRSWLGFGPRVSRTPQVGRSSTPHVTTTQSDLGARPAPLAESRDLHVQRSSTQINTQQSPPKPARLSRISSYMGLGSAAKAHAAAGPSPPYPEQITQRSEAMLSCGTTYLDGPRDPAAGVWHARNKVNDGFIYKESDQTWHNPSLTQMMDTVSSTIMQNGVSEPIPRHLNSFVIGMVEEFRARVGRQSALETQLDDLRNTRKKEVQEFAAMADEWKHREAAFKAEVKRLEQIIAGKEGMHSVVAARAGSVYNRNDTKAFQAKLHRLSKHDDEHLGLNKIHEIVMEGEMRNFAVLPVIKDSNREVVLDHNPDAFLSEIYRSGGKPGDKRNTSPDPLGQRLAAAQRFMDDNGRPRLPSDNSSKVTPHCKSTSTVPSSAVPSSASSSLIAQGVLAAAVQDDLITPQTSPPHPEPVKPLPGASAAQARAGLNALQTIQELAKMNGGLPEDAVDDESSYTPSLVPPHHERAESIDHEVGESVGKNVGRNGPRRSQLSPLGKTVLTQVDGPHSGGFQSPSWGKTPSSLSSGSTPSSCRSVMLMAMAHNCVRHAGQSGGPDCPRNSPTKPRQSGADPCPDEATKRRFRTERTILNADIRERSYMTTQELRAAMDDRTYPLDTQAPDLPAKLVHNKNVPRFKGPNPDILCPPGFEAHAAAGQVPFQHAAARRAARMSTVKKAAAERKGVTQEDGQAVERELASSEPQAAEETALAEEA